MKRIIVANWKMNPPTAKEAGSILAGIAATARGLKNTEAIICPPFLFLSDSKLKTKNSKLAYGAQDVFYESSGAFTGEVSVKMLKDAGVAYVIIGHSERRMHQGESDSLINKKVVAALAAGLKVILCVGERERVRGELPMVVKEELLADLANVTPQKAKNIIIAYEPIWAIGEGKQADTPEDLFEIVIYIRRTLLDIFGKTLAEKMPLLYGGSVDDKNAAAFLDVAGVQGLLVGRASLDAKKFGNILKIAEKLK
ncbi:MAG: triose-phosphate isomerase [Candidatus Niyogibacteria bacterium]|nr:triose-phosphate isomerase [Candidatus Niyogibacteria bacterium]